MFGFSGGEIVFIALIALVLFGNQNLPENMKKMIQGWTKAKKVANDVQKSWNDVRRDVEKSINFEEEKKKLKDLVKPISLDGDSPKKTYVSQNEIDREHKNQNYLASYIYRRLPPFLSNEEYMLSDYFVGPRI